MALATSYLREQFPKTSGLYRFGFYPEEGVCQLEFSFPKAALKHFAQRLLEFENRTGWSVRITGEVSDEELCRLVGGMFGTNLAGRIFISREAEEIRVLGSLDWADSENEHEFEDIAERFQRRTGFKIVRENA